MKTKKINEINLTGFNDACKLQFENVRLKGFPQVSIPTELMLVVTELSEAVQADRITDIRESTEEIKESIHKFEILEDILKESIYEDFIKDTLQMEVVDAIMRLMTFCGRYHIDVERLVKIKTWYNQTRPIRSGKRY